ncbi:MAG: hypothetical protein Q7W02_14615 [Candidatus Rokubacteria bacterium]|nr:hypothetical protein [Candidatus Rokubacteria bacterium]
MTARYATVATGGRGVRILEVPAVLQQGSAGLASFGDQVDETFFAREGGEYDASS